MMDIHKGMQFRLRFACPFSFTITACFDLAPCKRQVRIAQHLRQHPKGPT